MLNLKKVIAVGCAAIMAISTMSISAFAEGNYAIDNEAINSFKTISKEKIQNFFIESDEDVYYIEGFEFKDNEIKVTDSEISFETVVTVKERLHAETIDEIPYVDGYMSTFGISSYLELSNAEKRSATISSIGLNGIELTSEQEKVVDELIAFIDGAALTYGEYIGKTSEFNYRIQSTIKAEDINNITPEVIDLIGVNEYEGNVELSAYKLRSTEELYESGRNDAMNKMSETLIAPAWTATPIDNWSNYDRIAARNYAYTYWQNYNPAYSSYKGLGGDCANFVSQCLYAGGVPTSSTWRADSTTWIRVRELYPYMVNNGYATQTSYTNTTAGNFAVVSNDSHVVLITINDGSRIAYTGHTTDERDTVISNYSGYRFYVIKNF